MIGASGVIFYIFVPLIIIAGIIGITIGYFRKKARKNRNF